MQAQTQWIETSDRQQLYVKTWGEKKAPALILVHGYPDNQEVWERVIAVLVQDFYVVSYDVRCTWCGTILHSQIHSCL